MNNIMKKMIAEAIGTFVLVFVACGTAIISSGNLVATALAFGLVIVAMAYSIGRISGCHINPAVSLGCALSGRMSWKEFGLYCLAQVIGGFLGGIFLFAILKCAGVVETYLETAGSNFSLSGSLDPQGIFGSIGLEIILTCIFVYTILNVTSNKNKGVGSLAGIIIGLTLTLVHLVGIKFTGTSVNPARSLATALSNLIFTGNTKAISQVWMFIVGPMLGAFFAALIYNALHKEDLEEENN